MEFDGRALNEMSRDDYYLSPGYRPAGGGELRSDLSVSPAAAVASVTKVFFPHAIQVRGRRNGLPFRHCSATLNSVTLNQITYGVDVDVLIDEANRSHYVFVLPLRGSMMVETPHGENVLGVGSCMLMSPDVTYAFRHREADSHLAVGVPRRLLEAGKGLCRARLTRGVDPQRIADNTMSITDYLSFLCSELNRASDVLSSGTVRAGMESALIAMMQTMVARDVHAMEPSDGAVPGFVYRAEKFIASHVSENITIDHIVAAAGVPERTLYNGFRQFRETTPIKALRQRRLELIRNEIEHGANNGIRVIELANKYWMSHPGRFAAYYFDLYKESPSTTLRSARKVCICD